MIGSVREHLSTADGKDLLGRVALLAAVWAVFITLDPTFASTDSVFSVIQSFAFLGLVAVGVGVAMIAGELDLSAASVAAVAGIVAVKLSTSVGLVSAIAVTSLIGAVYGAAQGACISWLRINSVVFTIGTLFALRGVAYLLTNTSDSSAILLDSKYLDQSDSFIERLGIFSPYSLLTIGVLVIVGAVLGTTRWGREIYAIGGARRESRAAGVPQHRPLVLAFALSGLTASLAGAMSSIVAGSGSAQAFSNLLLLAVTAALIGGIGLYGGRGTMLNVAVGALILQSMTAGLTNEGATADVQQLATGGLLLLAIVIEFLSRRGPGAGWVPPLRRRAVRDAPATG